MLLRQLSVQPTPKPPTYTPAAPSHSNTHVQQPTPRPLAKPPAPPPPRPSVIISHAPRPPPAAALSASRPSPPSYNPQPQPHTQTRPLPQVSRPSPAAVSRNPLHEQRVRPPVIHRPPPLQPQQQPQVHQPLHRPQPGAYSLFGGNGSGNGFPGVSLDAIASKPVSNGFGNGLASQMGSSSQIPSLGGIAAYEPSSTAFAAKAPSFFQSLSNSVPVDRDKECLVCMAAARDMCCIPCGHVTMCEACAQEGQAANGAMSAL